MIGIGLDVPPTGACILRAKNTNVLGVNRIGNIDKRYLRIQNEEMEG
jgi:hypothetical protein